MTPEQALALLAQVVSQTRALPHEVDAMRQALGVLDELVRQSADGQGAD